MQPGQGRGRNLRDMPTLKYPGVLLLFLVSSLSPNQLCKLKTTAALNH